MLRSQPWWQRVTRLRATGATTAVAEIGRDAIQWRATARCEAGTLRVREDGAQAPLLDIACPGRKTAYAVGTGSRRLEVSGSGAWSIEVEQQVDVPLYEPPLPEMVAPGARAVLRGRLYRIDETASGAVTVYALPTGRFALRLRNVYVTPNVDLELRLSPERAPQTTADFRAAPSVYVAPLDVTAGSMNVLLPRGVDPMRYRSVVVWCPPVVSAYGAATLER